MTDSATPATLIHVDPSTLVDHLSNVRDDLGDLEKLTASIRQVGVLEPPRGRAHRRRPPDPYRAPPQGRGHRRSLTTVPCYERSDLADDRDQVLAILIENLRRDDLTELEEARGYQTLLDLGLSATKIAKAPGSGCVTPWP